MTRHENDNSFTANHSSCCVHRLKRSRKSPHSPSPARNSRCRIGGRRGGERVSHRQELSTSPSYCCCCEPEFGPTLLLETRHDAPDYASTLCIRVPSPLAWGRNNVRELRAKRRHGLRDDGRGSILTASPAVRSGYLLYIANRLQRQPCELLLFNINAWYEYLVHVVRVVSVSCETKEMPVFTRDMYGLKSDPRSGFFLWRNSRCGAERISVLAKNPRIITERIFRLDNDTDRSGADYPY